MPEATVLVTGGAGFIGSHVAEECLRLGMRVVVLDNLSAGSEENVPPGCELVRGDLCSPEVLSGLWGRYRFDYVYHLAAFASIGLSHHVRAHNYTTNVVGSALLINEAVRHDVRCFVFASSNAVYGRGQVPAHEEVSPRPEDPYGISKYSVELDLQAARRVFGLRSVIFRPHNVYGERQNLSDPFRNVLGIFMNQALRGRPMTIFGDGSQTRAFSYIRDVAPVIARAPLEPAAWDRIFNIGAEQPHTVRHLAETVAAALGRESRIEYHPARPEVEHVYPDLSRLREVFAPPAPMDLDTGVARMARWALERQLAAADPTPVQVEVDRGLPEAWLPYTTAGPAAGSPGRGTP